MPLKLNVGLSRKVADANYGSHGANINVELEIESALAGEPAKLQERIRQVFNLVRSSLDAELDGHGAAVPSTNGNGHATQPRSNGTNGQSTPRGGTAKPRRPATASQVRAIQAIAQRLNVDLNKVLHDDYRVGKAEDLSITDASKLIDLLKASEQSSGALS